MYGESDMIKSGGELIGFGFDYKVAKPLKLYVNYVEKTSMILEKVRKKLCSVSSTSSILVYFKLIISI